MVFTGEQQSSMARYLQMKRQMRQREKEIVKKLGLYR